jgi:hypothetical protein
MRLATTDVRRCRKCSAQGDLSLSKGSEGHGRYHRAVGTLFAFSYIADLGKYMRKSMSCSRARMTEEGLFERLPVVILVVLRATQGEDAV